MSSADVRRMDDAWLLDHGPSTDQRHSHRAVAGREDVKRVDSSAIRPICHERILHCGLEFLETYQVDVDAG